MNIKSDNLTFTLSKKALVVIIVYYILLIIFGVVIGAITILNIEKINQGTLTYILQFTVLSTAGLSAMMCSIQYVKRLYKAAITERIEYPTSRWSLPEIGNITYFITRPLIAIAFTIITIFILLSGLVVIVDSLSSIVNIRIFYLCIIASSIIGFSTGNVLDKFELFSKIKIEDSFKHLSKKETDDEEN